MRTISEEHYEQLFATCEILPDWNNGLSEAVALILEGRQRYEGVVEGATIPWVFPALLHHMEASCSFERSIRDGSLWRDKQHLSWEDDARMALFMKLPSALFEQVWTLGFLLKRYEMWNGLGYARKGIESPYLWSGSNHGVGLGKYTQDGFYDAQAVSKQYGAAVILKALVDHGVWTPEKGETE